jgi:hypothetical protein
MDFEFNKAIYAICGFNYPVRYSSSGTKNFYFNKTFSAWGFGTWKNRKVNEYYTPEELFIFMKSLKNVFKIYRMAPIKLLSILHAIKQNMPLRGDAVVSLENILHDQYCVFPTVSKVRNHGHDGSGVNRVLLENSIYLEQEIDSENEFVYDIDVPLIDKKMIRRIKKHFRMNLFEKLLTSILYVFLIVLPVRNIWRKRSS